MSTRDPVSATLAALDASDISLDQSAAVLTFGPHAAQLAAVLRERRPGAAVAELGEATEAGSGSIAVAADPLLQREPSAQRELLRGVHSALRPGGRCVVHSATVFSADGRGDRDRCCTATHLVLATRVGFEPVSLERQIVEDDELDLPSSLLGFLDPVERRTVSYDLILRRPEGDPDTSELEAGTGER